MSRLSQRNPNIFQKKYKHLNQRFPFHRQPNNIVPDGIVWDDLLISTSLFDFAEVNDPVWRDWQPSGAGTTFQILKFDLNDEVFFSCQLPHTYQDKSGLNNKKIGN